MNHLEIAPLKISSSILSRHEETKSQIKLQKMFSYLLPQFQFLQFRSFPLKLWQHLEKGRQASLVPDEYFLLRDIVELTGL